MSNKSGLKRVGYSDTKTGNVTYISGRISGDSDISPDNVKTEDTIGNVFGTGQISFSIGFFESALPYRTGKHLTNDF